MFLVQTPDGQQMLVGSLDGHEDCTVLDANAAPVTLADAKAMKRVETDAYLQTRLLRGFSATSGPLAGHTLQVRDSIDRTNWLTSQATYLAQINAGNGAMSGAEFRTTDNLTITCSYSAGYSTLLSMGAWGNELMRKSWSIKDQVNALTNAADVSAYDVAAAWEVA